VSQTQSPLGPSIQWPNLYLPGIQVSCRKFHSSPASDPYLYTKLLNPEICPNPGLLKEYLVPLFIGCSCVWREHHSDLGDLWLGWYSLHSQCPSPASPSCRALTSL
jgi:hypothetical protein